MVSLDFNMTPRVSQWLTLVISSLLPLPCLWLRAVVALMSSQKPTLREESLSCVAVNVGLSLFIFSLFISLF